MKITDVKVFPVDEDKLKAYATITFENCFIVRDLKVISGNKGYFIAMPSKKRKDGTFRDVAHPLNSETRKMIEDAVLEVYERENVTVSPDPSYHDDDTMEAESSAMDPEGDALEEDTTAAGSEELEPDDDSPGGDTLDAGSDEMGLEGDAAEENTVAAEEDTVAAEEVEGSEAFSTEAIDEETVVEDTGPVEPDQPEETGKGAEENPVIEGSDDPEKAFGYEE